MWPWESRGTQRVTGIAAGRGGVSHPHRAQPRGDPSAGPQVSTAELGGSCGRQCRCLRIDFSSSCRDSVTHAHVTQHRTLGHITQYPSAASPHVVGALGCLPSPSLRQCWGWRPRGSRLHRESSQVPRPLHIPSGNPTPPLEFSEEVRGHRLVRHLQPYPTYPRPALPSWGRPQPLTISTAIGHVGGGGLDPGHDLCQVGEARAGEGQHLGGSMSEARGPGVSGTGESRGPWSPGVSEDR